MKEKDGIEELFASSFKGQEVQPPQAVKANIDKELFGKGRFIFLSILILLITTVGLKEFSTVEPILEQNLTSEKIDANNAVSIEANKYNFDKVNESNKKALNGVSEINNPMNSDRNTSPNLMQIESEISPSVSNIYLFNPSEGSLINDKKRNNNTELTVNMVKAEEVSVVGGIALKPIGLLDFQSPQLIHQLPLNLSKSKKINGSISLYTGASFGVNNLNSPAGYEIQQDFGFNTSLEYSLNIYRNFGFSSGIEYASRNESFIENTEVIDSSYQNSYWEFIYLNPNLQDTIIDSNLVDVYSFSKQIVNYETRINTVSITVPIYLTYERAISNNLSFMLSGGVKLSYLKQKILTESASFPQPSYSNFGLSLLIRPEIRYDFNRFGIGMYFSSGYNSLTGMDWDSFNRQRFNFSGGVVLRLKL